MDPVTIGTIVGAATTLASAGIGAATANVSGRKAHAVIINETDFDWNPVKNILNHGKFQDTPRPISKISESKIKEDGTQEEHNIKNYAHFSILSEGAGAQGAYAYRCDELNVDLIFYLECLNVAKQWAGICMIPAGSMDNILNTQKPWQFCDNMHQIIYYNNSGLLPQRQLPGPGYVQGSTYAFQKVNWCSLRIDFGSAETTIFSIKNRIEGVPAEAIWKCESGGGIPANAVVAGREADRQNLYLARANCGGGWHPGKVRRGFNGANIPFDLKEYAVRDYEVFCGTRSGEYEWKTAQGGEIPQGAFIVGFESDGEPPTQRLYAARAYYGGGLCPGKVRPEFSGAHISYAGKEYEVTNYEVLCRSDASSVSWIDIGHANNVVGLTGLDGKLYCVTNENKLYARDPVARDIGWTHIGHANNVVGLAGLDGKLYCATNENKLYVRDTVLQDIGWTHIGHANNVEGLAGLNGKLYCATKERRLFSRDTVLQDIGWTFIRDAPWIVGLAGLEEKLYCVTGDNRLKMLKT